MLADWCETTQFLAAQRVALDNASRDLFLDALYEDFGVALKLLIRQAHGDYTPDTWPLRFPSLQLQQRHPVADQSPWKLFEAWTTARKPAAATIGRWRAVFIDLEAKFAGPNYEEPLNEDTAQAWAREKVTAESTAATVKDVWVKRSKHGLRMGQGPTLGQQQSICRGHCHRAPQDQDEREQGVHSRRGQNHLTGCNVLCRHQTPVRRRQALGALALRVLWRSRRGDYAVSHGARGSLARRSRRGGPQRR